MSTVELNEAFLAQIAGWEAVKRARALLASGAVLSSNWTPPLLKGVVKEGATAYRAGLVVKTGIDLENLCGCRDSRQWGTICAHSVAVGLHHLRRAQLLAAPVTAPGSAPGSHGPAASSAARTEPARSKGRGLRRVESGGLALKLHAIMPPNLGQAFARGNVMVCLEAEGTRGRVPLNAVDRNPAYVLSPEDARLLDYVEALAGGEPPGMIQLRAEPFARLLERLVGHPRVTLGKREPIDVSAARWLPALRAVLESNGEIVLSMRRPANASAPDPDATHEAVALLDVPAGAQGRDKPGGDTAAALDTAGLAGAPSTPGARPWVFRERTLQPVGLTDACREVLRGSIRLARPQVPLFFARDWPVLAAGGAIEANFTPDQFSFAPRPPRFILTLSGGLSQLAALIQCAYGPRVLPLGLVRADEEVWVPDPDCSTRYATRDPAAEEAALVRLRRAGFTGPDTQGRWLLTGQNGVLNFFARELERMQRDWEVTLEARLETSVERNIERIQPNLAVTPSGENWFDLCVDYRSASGVSFAPGEIQRLLRSGQSYQRLATGKFALLDIGAVEEFQEVLVDCAPQQHGGGYRMANAQAGYLAATIGAQAGWKLQAPENWRHRGEAGAPDRTPCPPLGDLEPQLRAYQKAGVAWLHFLAQNRFGGVLADEMGLGKTVQMLAFLRTRTAAGARPSLVVCPTSLVFNWVAEASRFTPELRVRAIHGADRASDFEALAAHDLVVTSYALLRRDAERYRGVEFDVVVLDEAQHIKNRQTQNAQAVKAIAGRQRFVLTGTPLENSVLDLWSIFDYLMPGYLGTAQDFRERYEAPIARARDAAAQTRLARRIRPFLLRRLKRDVVRDLPAKLEQVSLCELTPTQAAAYREVLEASRREIADAVGAQGLAQSRMLVFTALLRLRQICCDVRLLKLSGVDPAQSSGKLDLFDELLEEILDGGHRVLVFSQFTSLLALIRERLDAASIGYAYLDGSTPNRAEVVAQFQSDERLPVFLLSLKAGGVGLNLTGADTVVHLDPWWNPAVEDQATDRAHRIGQTRVVTSYKLITRDTVEEKILNLQRRKRELLQGALGDEESLSQALTWDEIQELMA